MSYLFLVCTSGFYSPYKVGEGYIACDIKLSKAAKVRIANDIANGVYNGKEGATEPHYMAPSQHPENYSKVRCWVLLLHTGTELNPEVVHCLQ